MCQNSLIPYIPPKLVVTEAVEIKIRSSKKDFHHVCNNGKLLEYLVLGGDSQTLYYPADSHGDVGYKKYEAHHEEQSDKTFIPP